MRQPAATVPEVDQLLTAAVTAIGGQAREGQERMARAVAEAVQTGEHLLAQAGTGTGKSLAYLVPALAHAVRTGRPVVVATATLALQAQVAEQDLPRVVDALTPLLPRRPVIGLVKGRSNYLCRHKLLGGFPDEETLFDVPAQIGDGLGSRVDGASSGRVDGVASGDPAAGTSAAGSSTLGRHVLRLREWAERTGTGDRDDLVPGVPDRAWRQVSVTAHECLGQVCPLVDSCFTEQVREAARGADVVVTNHAMLAIDSFEGRQLLPRHDLVVVDEAHELVDRVTATITDELAPSLVDRAARRASRLTDTTDLESAVSPLQEALGRTRSGRLTEWPEPLVTAITVLRDAARATQSALRPERGEAPDGTRQQARADVDEVTDVCDRLLRRSDQDVPWLTTDPRRGPVLHVAPLSVAGLLQERLYPDRTVVLTSATLALGGSFDAVAPALGLAGPHAPAWRGLDVGSPFDYRRQAILYCARHLPAPSRHRGSRDAGSRDAGSRDAGSPDGATQAVLDELADLIRAAGGRTLGLFSSRRAAETAAAAMRDQLELPVLCQGDDQTPTLVREFVAQPRSCLFGTLSLWQGVDVPGAACHLVVIDRIPFPRPDDPVMSARAEAVSAAGGNGFIAVSATHAALRLAQGTGRLVRSATDRGVVAVLDPRLATARYGAFLRASLPPLWPTADRDVVIGALRRLDAAASQ
ncbi:MAG: ATP-dependent DNA helicase [Angustibacter sp.]